MLCYQLLCLLDQVLGQTGQSSPSLVDAFPFVSCSFLTYVAYGLQLGMIEVRKTSTFATWLDNLRDIQARARIQVRIRRLSQGLAGDVKPVGEGVSEMRIDYGPGYRVYYCQRGEALVFLLAGGDKRTQSKDIATALKLARTL